MGEAAIDATMDPMGSVHRLGDLTWLDVRDQSRIVLIPLGSLEQHGPHLPLITDLAVAGQVETFQHTWMHDHLSFLPQGGRAPR